MTKPFLRPDGKIGWMGTGFHFRQLVNTPNGMGLIQGIVKNSYGSIRLIISHDLDTMPPELVPEPTMKLICYSRVDVTPRR
ncbi:MAG: hypothetical protein WC341_00475 [Bacteroidales bacterium]|jgi:hypothetical protein